MIEYCCLGFLLVIVVFILLALITRIRNFSNYHYNPRNNKRVNGKICIKCGNVSNVDSKYCNHCGNEF